MMTDWEHEQLEMEVRTLASAARARGTDVAVAVRSIFKREFARHPDDEHRLLELWDRVTARPVY